MIPSSPIILFKHLLHKKVFKSTLQCHIKQDLYILFYPIRQTSVENFNKSKIEFFNFQHVTFMITSINSMTFTCVNRKSYKYILNEIHDPRVQNVCNHNDEPNIQVLLLTNIFTLFCVTMTTLHFVIL